MIATAIKSVSWGFLLNFSRLPSHTACFNVLVGRIVSGLSPYLYLSSNPAPIENSYISLLLMMLHNNSLGEMAMSLSPFRFHCVSSAASLHWFMVLYHPPFLHPLVDGGGGSECEISCIKPLASKRKMCDEWISVESDRKGRKVRMRWWRVKCCRNFGAKIYIF